MFLHLYCEFFKRKLIKLRNSNHFYKKRPEFCHFTLLLHFTFTGSFYMVHHCCAYRQSKTWSRSNDPRQFPNKFSKRKFNANNNLCPFMQFACMNWNKSAFKVTAIISSLVYLSCNYINTQWASVSAIISPSRTDANSIVSLAPSPTPNPIPNPSRIPNHNQKLTVKPNPNSVTHAQTRI